MRDQRLYPSPVCDRQRVLSLTIPDEGGSVAAPENEVVFWEGMANAVAITRAEETVPPLIAAAGSSARFAFEEYVFGKLRNKNTRRAYLQAIDQFLSWCQSRNLQLQQISPRVVGAYFDSSELAPTTKNLHLSAIRHLFDELVKRHAIVLNPAAGVRRERHEVVEGKTPEIAVNDVHRLFESFDTDDVIGLRDRAIIGTLVYTAARVGAIARLRYQSFHRARGRSFLRFIEKGGKAREIPVRVDLHQFIADYLTAAGFSESDKSLSLFRATAGRSKKLLVSGMTATDIGRMLKRRMRDAGLPDNLSPHSFRVTTITNLLTQGVSLEDVQYLAGHADPRTTRLYDRREKRLSDNVVDKIAI